MCLGVTGGWTAILAEMTYHMAIWRMPSVSKKYLVLLTRGVYCESCKRTKFINLLITRSPYLNMFDVLGQSDLAVFKPILWLSNP